jgi:hypothetical protein
VKKGKIIITGTGRAGTSFLMVLLTRLSLDTGYKPYIEDFNEKIRAGCELKVFSSDLKKQRKLLKKAPRILKHPKFSQKLDLLIEKNLIRVDHIIVPIRDIKEASQSRAKNNLPWAIKGLETQEQVLTWALGKITETASKHNIPITFLRYPKLLEDPDYCFKKLELVFKLNKKKFLKIHQELVGAKRVKKDISIFRKLLYKIF